MIVIDVSHTFDQLEKELTAIERTHLPIALQLALNGVGSKLLTMARREIARRMNLSKQSTIRPNFGIRKATRSKLVVTVFGTGKPLSLAYFRGTRQTTAGVVSAAWGSRRVYRGTFLATMASGHRAAFVRKHPFGRRVGPRVVMSGPSAGQQYYAELPIREIYGPSVPKEMAADAFEQAARAFVDAEFPAILRSKLEFRLHLAARRR